MGQEMVRTLRHLLDKEKKHSIFCDSVIYP